MKKKKIFLVLALIVFSFIFVAFQSSILVPNIIENTQCECKPCTLEDRFEQYMSTSNNNIITNNNSKIILLFMGYAWISTLLIDIILYNIIEKKLIK